MFLFSLVAANILYGVVMISFREFFDLFLDWADQVMYNIVFLHVAPQVIISLLMGITLFTTGMLLQFLFRNSFFSGLLVALFSLFVLSVLSGYALIR